MKFRRAISYDGPARGRPGDQVQPTSTDLVAKGMDKEHAAGTIWLEDKSRTRGR